MSQWLDYLRPPWRAALALGVLGALVYLPTLGNAFVYDDLVVIVENDFVHHLANLSRYFEASFADKPRPFLVVTVMVDNAIWGLHPFGHHLQNILWHGVATGLVVLLLRRLFSSPIVAAAGGALFALHPIQSEAVAGVSFRDDLLATTFALLTVLAVLRWQRTAGGKRWLYLGAAWLTLLLGLCSKESAIVTPALVVVGVWAQSGRSNSEGETASPYAWWRPALIGAAVLATTLVPFRWLNPSFPLYRWLGLRGGGPIPRAPGGLPTLAAEALPAAPGILDQVGVALGILGQQVGMLVLPVGQSIEYVVDLEPPSLAAVGAVLVLAALVILVWRQRRMPTAASFGAAWLLVALVPVSVPALLYTPRADRFLYMPMIGVAALFGWAVSWLLAEGRSHRLRRASTIAVPLLLVVLGAATVARTLVWHDELSLWRDAVAKAPQSARAQGALAKALQNAGELEAAKERYQKAIAIDPDYALLNYNYGQLLYELGELDQAEEAFRRVIAQPDRRDVRRIEGYAELRLGHVALKRGDTEAAIAHLERAAERKPNFFVALNQLGQIYAATGRLDQAVTALERAIAGDPQNPLGYNNLGAVLVKQNKIAEARKAFSEALRREPDNLALQLNLGILSLTQGDNDAAVTHFRKVLEQDPDNQQAKIGLERATQSPP